MLLAKKSQLAVQMIRRIVGVHTCHLHPFAMDSLAIVDAGLAKAAGGAVNQETRRAKLVNELKEMRYLNPKSAFIMP